MENLKQQITKIIEDRFNEIIEPLSVEIYNSILKSNVDTDVNIPIQEKDDTDTNIIISNQEKDNTDTNVTISIKEKDKVLVSSSHSEQDTNPHKAVENLKKIQSIADIKNLIKSPWILYK